MQPILITQPRPALLFHDDFREITGFSPVSLKEARQFVGERVVGPVVFDNALMPKSLGWVDDAHGVRRLALTGRGLFELLLVLKGFDLELISQNHSDVLGQIFDRDHYGYHAAVEFLDALQRRGGQSEYANLIGMDGKKLPVNRDMDFYEPGEVFDEMLEKPADEPSITYADLKAFRDSLIKPC